MVTLRPLTPTEEEEGDRNPQQPTPVKTKVRVLTEFAQQYAPSVSQADIFKFCKVKKRSGWRMLEKGSQPRRHHNQPYSTEKRGRKSLLSKEDFEKIEDFIIENGFPGRVATYLEIV